MGDPKLDKKKADDFSAGFKGATSSVGSDFAKNAADMVKGAGNAIASGAKSAYDSASDLVKSGANAAASALDSIPTDAQRKNLKGK